MCVLTPDQATAPLDEVLQSRLDRRGIERAELNKSPLTADLPSGGKASWVVVDPKKTAFDHLTALRKALQPLLEENPATLTVLLSGATSERRMMAEATVYVALLNAAELPSRKSKQDKPRLTRLVLYGCPEDVDFTFARAVAEGNTLARTLTMLPPNELTPAIYRRRIGTLAARHGWQYEEYDLKALRKLGAGAFVAVAQGSDPEDAAIVHLSYSPKKATKTVALVGKGICFDTGGHNLKPARYMHGMHEDMNGSAVCLGILLAASRSKLPIRIDGWLALAQNHISPRAYKQNDVVKALNGTTIEVVHTDAEGRMVLADTLTLASRGKPDLVIDFATLTGSMAVALGDRMSGVIGNRPALVCQAVEVGRRAGERLCAFPFEADYDEALESKIADIKQCTLDSEADHILAARFLSKFIEHDVPWLHIDLSSSNCKGGLGAVSSDVNGFGVSWGVHWLRNMMGKVPPHADLAKL
ncbi:MAG: leucyl aminopeptidase family protein [Methylophilaceae bacterium]|nr:leucyl aminopeptidase family protein [Methylophilaceae bacterium]